MKCPDCGKPSTYSLGCKACCRRWVKASAGKESQVYAAILAFKPDWMTPEDEKALRRSMTKKNGGSSGGD